MHLKSALLEKIPNIRHGFGSLDEEVPSHLADLWSATHASWRQVHGVGCVRLESAHQKGLEGDCLWTDQAGLAVAVVTADCVPILLARRDGSKAAAIHAGWRGTRAHILSKFFEIVRAQGDEPSQWVAATGPSIGPCCYEVSEELAGDFKRDFPEISALAVPRFRHLDLPAINEAELRRLGVFEVDLLRACTKCSVSASGAPLFHSYRREGGGTRQYSVIALTD